MKNNSIWRASKYKRMAYFLIPLIMLIVSSSAFATFPGQNGKIVFELYDPVLGISSGISLMNADGSGETVLTTGQDHAPHWSADGSKIVFYRSDTHGFLYVMDADGSNITQITPAEPSSFIVDARFSPDGTQIVFENRGSIVKCDITGCNPVQLAPLLQCPLTVFPNSGTAGKELPSWSPDGTKIAFDAWCGSTDGSWGLTDLYMMNSDGSNVVNITNNTAPPNLNVYDYFVDWSPDGTKLVFVHSTHSLDFSTNTFSIFTSNTDGSNRVAVFGPTNQNLCCPNWSPDGTKILFDGGSRSYWPPQKFPFVSSIGVLYVMNSDGSNLNQITDNSEFRSCPNWQPIPAPPPSYTPSGNDVAVQPVDPTTGTTPATLTFSSVSQAGDTNVVSSTSGPTTPAGFKVGEPAVFYDISTTAAFSGTVTLCFTWTEGQFDNESNIALFHYENGAWQNVTTSLDTNGNQVCGETFSLSPFAIFEVSYTFTGFFPPVDNPPTRNVAKAGSAVPVKFSLGGNQGLAIFNPGYPASQPMQCDTSATLSDIEETVMAGGSSLSYDSLFDQYTYVWKSEKAWANSCRRLVLKFNDGTIKTADFTFSK